MSTTHSVPRLGRESARRYFDPGYWPYSSRHLQHATDPDTSRPDTDIPTKFCSCIGSRLGAHHVPILRGQGRRHRLPGPSLATESPMPLQPKPLRGLRAMSDYSLCLGGESRRFDGSESFSLICTPFGFAGRAPCGAKCASRHIDFEDCPRNSRRYICANSDAALAGRSASGKEREAKKK